MLRGFAEAVEEQEKKDGDDGVDSGSDSQVKVEPGLWLRKKDAPRENDNALMRNEENYG